MSVFDAHEMNMSHEIGCPGCTAMMVRREVAQQLAEILEPDDCGECTACLNDGGACLNPPGTYKIRLE